MSDRPLDELAYEKMWDALEDGLRAGRDPSDPKEFHYDEGYFDDCEEMNCFLF